MPPNFFDKIIISDTSCLIALTNTGNLDILIAAYRQGIIADLNPIIASLKACDFRLPRDLPDILSAL
jgi:predicted nucleic acid-binding protein